MARPHLVPCLLLAHAFLMVWSGCTRPVATVPPATQTVAAAPATEPVSPAGTVGAPPGKRLFQITHYAITCEIEPARHWLKATAEVDLRAIHPEFHALAFDLRPNLKISRLDVGEEKDLTYSRDKDGAVTVNLAQALTTGETRRMTVTYEGEINGPRGGANNQRVWDYIGPEGTYVRFEAGWYPQSEGDAATADVTIKVPTGWQAVSSGKLVSGADNAFHWRTDIPAMGLSFTAARYSLTEDRAGNIPLQCYTFPAHARRAQEYLRNCGEILALYEKLYGPYPFPKFAIAEIPDLYGGGHGDQSFIMLQARSFREPFDGEFVAHEMAHNWWGSSLMCTESEFMQEGFATYSQALYREHKSGKAALQKAMRAQAEAVLINSLDPAQEKSCYASDSGPLLYEKGAWILHMLRRLVGDDQWFATVQRFATGHAGQIVTCSQLQQAFEQAHGESLDWFLQQWLYGKGVPWVKGEVISAGPGAARVRLTQQLVKGEGQAAKTADPKQTWDTEPCNFRLPVDLALKHSGGTARQTVWLTQASQEFSLSVSGKVTGLTIDPDGWLLCHSKGLVGELDADMKNLEQELQRELERDLKDLR